MYVFPENFLNMGVLTHKFKRVRILCSLGCIQILNIRMFHKRIGVGLIS
jgi:hypothetical protein